MFKRVIALVLLLAMCLSVLPLGAVAYGQQDTLDSVVDETNLQEKKIIENYSPFTDAQLAYVLGFISKAESYTEEDEMLLDAFIKEMYTFLLDEIEKIKDGEDGNQKITWSNIANNNYKYPLKYYANPVTEEQKYAKSVFTHAINAVGRRHPVFSAVVESSVAVTTGSKTDVDGIAFTINTKDAKKKVEDFLEKSNDIVEYFRQLKSTGQWKDEQIVLLVHDYFAGNTHYDMATMNKFDAYGLVVNYRSVCDGQAQALCYVLNQLQFPCRLIMENVNLNHAWNIVTIGQKDYHLCLTAADTSYDKFGEIDHSCFLISTRQYIRHRLGEEAYDSYDNPEDIYKHKSYLAYATRTIGIRNGEIFDTAMNTEYEGAFWENVGSAFVPCKNGLLFISKEGKLCIWEAGKGIGENVTATESSDETREQQCYKVISGDDEIDGTWAEEDNGKFHKIIIGNWFDEDEPIYYISTGKEIRLLTIQEEQTADGEWIYSYQYKDDGESDNEYIAYSLPKDSDEYIYDFCVNDNEFYINIAKNFETVDSEKSRHEYFYLGETMDPVSMIYDQEYEDGKLRHIIRVNVEELGEFDSASVKCVVPYYQEYFDNEERRLRLYGEYRNIFEIKKEDCDTDGYYTVRIDEPKDGRYSKLYPVTYKSTPISVVVRVTKDKIEKQTKPVMFNQNRLDVEIEHKVDFTDGVTINYVVKKTALEGYDADSIRLLCRIPLYYDTKEPDIKKSSMTGSKAVELKPKEDGDYYYFTLSGLTISQVTDEIRSVLFAKNENGYFRTEEEIYAISADAELLDAEIRPDLKLTDDMTLNMTVPKDELEGCDKDTVFVLMEVGVFTKGNKVGTKIIKLLPEEKGDDYYFALPDLTASQALSGIKSILFAKNENGYFHTERNTYELSSRKDQLAEKISHNLNLASDISVNLAVHKDKLEGYDMTTVFAITEVAVYEGNTKIGTETRILYPEEKGNYYYFTLEGLTAVNMNDRIRSVLHGIKDGREYYSVTDNYSIADYAYAQIDKTVPKGLKTLCADLLRYGAMTQIYKGYRTDALVDAEMTEEQKAFLSDIEAVTFSNNNTVLDDLSGATVTWAGKALDLGSKVCVKYVFSMDSYAGSVDELTLHVRYMDIDEVEKNLILTEAELYRAKDNLYAFSFDGLLAAELRSVVSVQIYHGDTPVSCTLQYSADTYGNNKPGALGDVCKALIAYSDSAKAYFLSF